MLLEMSSFRADLHCHTTCSDGTLTPTEVVELAAEVGLQGLSITDHDTVAAYGEAMPVAEKLGIALVSGIELSALHEGASVHILGYAFDLESRPLLELCARCVEWRGERNRAILEKLREAGYPVEDEELPDQQVVGRPHIAQALVAKGLISTINEAFRELIGDGCPCYVEGEHVGVEEAIDVIHAAGGLAVIAHPHLIRNQRIVDRLLQMPFDGLEGRYGTMPPWKERRWVRMGEERGWIVTGGSDFHGAVKPHIELGCSWVRDQTFNRLLEHGKA
jgi:3',5'-nucleoside bisphosphate phosphatase